MEEQVTVVPHPSLPLLSLARVVVVVEEGVVGMLGHADVVAKPTEEQGTVVLQPSLCAKLNYRGRAKVVDH